MAGPLNCTFSVVLLAVHTVMCEGTQWEYMAGCGSRCSVHPESISVETHSHPQGGLGRKYAGSSDAGLFTEKAMGMLDMFTVLTTGLLVA